MLPKLFVGPWSFLRVSSHGGARLAAVASLVGGVVVAALAPRTIGLSAGRPSGTSAVVAAAPGDTQVVFGPRVFSTPNGRPTNYVEALSLVVQPTRRYTLRLVNGAADGTQRATSGSLSLNGKLLFQGPDFFSGATLTRVVEPLSADTLLVTVEGPAGAFVTVSILADPDPTFTVYAERFTRTGGPTVTDTRSFALPAGAAPPYYLHLVNGNANGTSRMADGSIVVNGQTVATFDNHVGSVAVPVALAAQNTFQVLARAQGSSSGFLDVRFAATDTTHPAITITSPAPGLITRDTLVTVAGSVQDQTATSVAVNGQAASMTGNAFSLSARLAAEGQNTLHIVATDAAGHSTDSVRTVIRDTQQPVLTVTSPANNALTKQTSITVSGSVTDQTAVTVNANGVPLPVDGAGQFTGQVPLAEGQSFVTVTATDAAGNAATVVRSVTRDTQAPVLTVTAPVDGAVINADHVTVRGTVTDATAVTVTANGTSLPVAPDHSFSGDVALTDGPNTIAVVATDAAGNSATVSRSVTRQSQNLPPDPATVAPPNDPTVPTNVATSTAFLYSGPNPIQTGVSPGTIVPTRAAVIRGKVLTRDGQPLPGAKVTILGHPEFGQTLSRADGMFDLAVNGGGAAIVNYEKAGYLSAQRPADVPWRDYVIVDDAALVQLDPQVTAIDFAQPAEVARGSVVTDQDGTRQATLIFSQGTVATLVMADGSTQGLSSIHVRATEYTVGPSGPRTMPAPLPPASGYTYAVELSADEARAAGARAVEFSQPVAFYVENFLAFPVGTDVPVGYYDRDKAAWVPADNGRVIKVLDTSGPAQLDVDGSGQAAGESALAALGITQAERERLSALYAPGQTLWRVRVTHLTPWDCNWPYGPPLPPDALAPKANRPGASGPDQGCDTKHSIICIEAQSLGEEIPLVGTPYTLRYESERVPGYAATADIPLIGDTVPPALRRIELEVTIAGRLFADTFPPLPNQSKTFVWNGRDAYGRLVRGGALATIKIAYVYPALYKTPEQLGQAFAAFGGATFARDERRLEVKLLQTEQVPLGLTNTADWSRLGLWTISAHHSYNPDMRVLSLGDGTRRTAVGGVPAITRFTGSGAAGFSGDGAAASDAKISGPAWAKAGPDGSVYIADQNNNRIRRITPDGIIGTVAGTGQRCSSRTDPCGDGGPATQAQLTFPTGVDLGPDGSIYIADQGDLRIRRVGPDGNITTLAGSGQRRERTVTFGSQGITVTIGPTGDGGLATEAPMQAPLSVAWAPDGSVYLVDGGRIRRVGPGGIITTVAGNDSVACEFSSSCPDSGDGRLARHVALNGLFGLAVGPDGSFYTSEFRNGNRLRRVTPDGILHTVAGDGTSCSVPGCGDGGKATSAQISPWGMALAPDGSLYVADLAGQVVRIVSPDGFIRSVAGSRSLCFPPTGACGDNGPATAARLYDPAAVAVGPDGSLYVVELDGNKVRRVAPALPGVLATDITLASADGGFLYDFDAFGRHLRTFNTFTGAIAYSFGYDSVGRLIGITGTDGLVTQITRGADGGPTAIVSPDGHRTTLTADAQGALASVTDPAGESVVLTSKDDGLLSTLTDARGGVHRFDYDSTGRLIRDEDPTGAVVTLSKSVTDSGFNVAMSSPLGRTSTHGFERRAIGGSRRTITGVSGLRTVSLTGSDGADSIFTPDGTVIASTVSGDPRFGMQAPVLHSLTVQLPSGLSSTMTNVARDSLSNAADPLSLVSQTDSLSVNGKTTVTRYAAATRSLVQTSPEGRQVFATLDTTGRVVSARVGDLDSVSFTYDARGRLTRQQEGGRLTSYAYSPTNGRLASVTDALGRVTQFAYDSAGRVTRQTFPDGREVQFGYDASGDLTSLTPPGRPSHGFQYTPVDLIAQYDPPGIPGPKPTRYFYNLDRQLDSIVRPDSVTVAFSYDSTGRPTMVRFDRGTLTYGYSSSTGSLAAIRAPTGDSLAFSHDGGLVTAVHWSGTVTGSVEVTFNADLRIASQTVNGAREVGFSYDRDGLLTSAGALVLKRSATNGLLTADTVGSVAGAYHYTSHGELQGSRVTANDATVLAAAYDRDTLGRITQSYDTTLGVPNRWSFAYDSVDRLVAVSANGIPLHAFTYDANGNRLSYTSSNGTIAYSYDAQDRLLSAGTTNYAYGSNGELRTKTVLGVGATSYRYDAFGNLITVLLPGGTHIDYVVDGQNRRIGKKVNGVLVQGWLYQNQVNPVAELDVSGNVVSRFVYGTRATVPDYLERNGLTYRMISDRLGSVRLVLDAATGTVVQRIDYDEWGNVTLNTNPGFQPFGFAGGLYDDDTKLERFGLRDYDPETGRWTTRDPLRFGARDPNLYGYVLNNPVSLTDPLGLDPCVEMTGAGQIIVDNTIADRAAGFINAAVQNGWKGTVNEDFRTRQQQEFFWEKYHHDRRRAAEPGTGEHEGGFAFDLAFCSQSKSEQDAVLKAAKDFGFKQNVAGEPWHFSTDPSRDQLHDAIRIAEDAVDLFGGKSQLPSCSAFVQLSN